MTIADLQAAVRTAHPNDVRMRQLALLLIDLVMAWRVGFDDDVDPDSDLHDLAWGEEGVTDEVVKLMSPPKGPDNAKYDGCLQCSVCGERKPVAQFWSPYKRCKQCVELLIEGAHDNVAD